MLKPSISYVKGLPLNPRKSRPRVAGWNAHPRFSSAIEKRTEVLLPVLLPHAPAAPRKLPRQNDSLRCVCPRHCRCVLRGGRRQLVLKLRPRDPRGQCCERQAHARAPAGGCSPQGCTASSRQNANASCRTQAVRMRARGARPALPDWRTSRITRKGRLAGASACQLQLRVIEQ